MKPISGTFIILGLATSLSAIGLALGSADLALAARGGGGGGGGGHWGGGGGGGGGGHWGGGGGGHWGGGGGAVNFGAAHIGHTNFGHANFPHNFHANHVHASHWSGGHHYAHVNGHGLSHSNTIHTHANELAHTNGTMNHEGKINGEEKTLNSHVTPLKDVSDPKNFGARRDLAAKAAFQPFWHQGWHEAWWHRNHFFHLGWLGPWFWPYAYGDFFYCGLWPWDYCYYDPFWAYGYGDIYQAVFFPYSYDDYVQGPRAPERVARLKQAIGQSCDQEAGEVTGWPIDQIQAAVQPDQHQRELLDSLGNAIVQASDAIRSHCSSNLAFTPTERLAQMRDRLQSLVDAVNVVNPPLSSFYDSLSDEQKARFNDVAPPQPRTAQRGQTAPGDLTGATIQSQCGAGVMAWPTDQIDRVVRPDDTQRAKLQALQSAAGQAADMIKAACPTEVPATPPARLAAEGKRLQAMLQGVETMQPALADFYDSLSDDQKARFNTMGRQLFTQNAAGNGASNAQ
jgi:LTXXQ motif family protein